MVQRVDAVYLKTVSMPLFAEAAFGSYLSIVCIHERLAQP